MFNSNSFGSKYAKLGIKFNKGKAVTNHLYTVVIINRDTSLAFDWCEEKFKDDWIWSKPMHTDYTIIYFKNSEDALLFKLAFSNSLYRKSE